MGKRSSYHSILLKFFLLLFSMHCCNKNFAQDFEWWKSNVHWDGSTHWYKYLIISPEYFGPNALSVPELNTGSIDTATYLGTSANFHFSSGDKTQNLKLSGNYYSQKSPVSISFQYIPLEVFQMDAAEKSRRYVYYKEYYTKVTTGDVLVNTNVQFFKKHIDKFRMALRGGFRIPAGQAQGATRYTDGPAYWIDAGFGIPLPFKNKTWSWLGMLGFFAWQTNSDVLRQDDALLYGTGIERCTSKSAFRIYVAGYEGYKENGDQPLVFRLKYEKRIRGYSLFFSFQKGLQDFRYTSLETGYKYIF